MKVKTLEGSEIDLKPDTLDRLKLRLRGMVLVPGDAGYEESRTVWNAMIDRKPALIVRCLGAADVIASVQFAREHNLLLCIKGGGHNIAGLAMADGALLLDMSLMRGVWVDKQAAIAHAQAGCLLGDVDRETQLDGLAAVLGFVSQTGVAGLTLGGGFGYLTRRWGWTTDNVVGMDVVTANGQRVRASSDENADLFWGLRGGRRKFRRRDRHRLQALPGWPRRCRRPCRLACQRGAWRSRALPDAGRESPPRTYARLAHAPGSARALAPQGYAWEAHRGPAGVLQRKPRGRRKDRCPHQGVWHTRSATCWCAGRMCSSKRCSTPLSRRAGATTGRASTSRASNRPWARRSSSMRPESDRAIRP